MINPKIMEERRYAAALVRGLNLSGFELDEAVTDSPDVVYCYGGRRIGIEVTGAYRSPTATPHLDVAKEAERNIIANMAKEFYAKKGGDPLLVYLHFNASAATPRDRKAISEWIGNLILANAPTPGSPFEWESKFNRDANAPVCLISIRAYLLPNSSSLWTVPFATFPEAGAFEAVERCVLQKNALLPAYLTNCDECWLLIFADSKFSGSMIDWPNDLGGQEIESDFSRVYFYDRFSDAIHLINSK